MKTKYTHVVLFLNKIPHTILDISNIKNENDWLTMREILKEYAASRSLNEQSLTGIFLNPVVLDKNFFDVYPTPKDVVPELNKENLTAHMYEGNREYFEGYDSTENPFHPDSKEAAEWLMGWEMGQETDSICD